MNPLDDAPAGEQVAGFSVAPAVEGLLGAGLLTSVGGVCRRQRSGIGSGEDRHGAERDIPKT